MGAAPWGCPGGMRRDHRDTFPGEKSRPQALFAGGRKAQPFAVAPGAVPGRGWLVRVCWGGSRSTFPIHSPTSASSVVYEPPSLPFPSRLTHGFQLEGKATWGSSLAQGEHRARTGRRLPSHRDTSLLARPDFRAAAKLPMIPNRALSHSVSRGGRKRCRALWGCGPGMSRALFPGILGCFSGWDPAEGGGWESCASKAVSRSGTGSSAPLDQGLASSDGSASLAGGAGGAGARAVCWGGFGRAESPQTGDITAASPACARIRPRPYPGKTAPASLSATTPQSPAALRLQAASPARRRVWTFPSPG